MLGVCVQKIGLFLAGYLPAIAFANDAVMEHHDPIAPVILWVTFIFLCALIGRYIAQRYKQPAVLGELLMGVLVGNLFYLLGSHLIVVLREGSAVFNIMKSMLNGVSLTQAIDASIPNSYYAHQVANALSHNNGVDLIKIAYILDIFSQYGVIFLLFKVGLESSIEELKHTGRESVQVAIIGVAAPILLGFLVAYMLSPGASYKSHLFVAATLSATSIGITARVLSEMKKLRTREAKTILGAAMIDDILGLIILAIVSSIVLSGVVDVMMVTQIIISAIAFFAGALLIGPWIVRKAVLFFRFLELWELKLFIAFIFVMTLAWLATVFHLATIIGAFAAGLILHDDFFDSEKSRGNSQSIGNLITPLESILAPLFFMLIGIQVKLEAFGDWQVLLMASGLIAAAILGKLISGLGGSKKDDRWLIGIGMLPRGEVGLVFASIGRTLGVISDQLFSAIILMVIVTTFIAPPLLKARYMTNDKKIIKK
ncbi:MULTISPECIES: cation:proton antiporter [Legionella]|uniref:Na(+)/H(+) antiporter n=1 Tax=Legionella maceachernii TaxID=466 RepID=A0A0W0WGR0_9GAMM|nr:cation:proton antiporter [Legionella maceachernii]KTD31472.1 Na(+)/H(+) antiporter [Legionella maceachernii]SJZ94221.1 sodium/proton antiporter NhaS3, CPA2 family (TC 2.A.37.2.4) [Legionella maceachernii]SUP03387.1 K(+)/H(+) antiporter yhaU [Legionella maceachernii]